VAGGLTLALAVAIAAAGCSSSSGATQNQDGLTIYNGQHEQTTSGLVTAFEKQTGIQVSVRSDDEGALANLIALQGQNSPADVFYTENSPALEFLQGKQLLAATSQSTLSQLPTQYNSPRGDWVAVSARVSAIVYNPALIAQSDLPTTVMQLADPKYGGKLGLAPSETDFAPMVTSVLKAYGTQQTTKWLQGVKANSQSHIAASNETLIDQVNRGQVAFGVINQYYWYRLQSQIGSSQLKAKLAFFAPHDPGYVIDVSGAAVLKSSKHQQAAQKFLAFLVSKQGQEIIAGDKNSDTSYEYPLLAGVNPAGGQPSFASLQPYPITIADLGDGETANTLLQQAGLR
jgi:iron(III) transport system substrate-binding protein